MSASCYEARLIAGLAHPIPDIAATCAWVLGERRARAAVAPLCALLRQRTDLDDVRIAAIRALAQIGDPAALPTLIAVARTGDVRVRLAAVEALRQVDPLAARAVLDELAHTDPSAAVRHAARAASAVTRDDGTEDEHAART